MNLQPITNEFKEAVNEGCRMVSLTLFRRKVKNQWEWCYDVKTIEMDGRTVKNKRAIPLDSQIVGAVGNDPDSGKDIGAGSFI